METVTTQIAAIDPRVAESIKQKILERRMPTVAPSPVAPLLKDFAKFKKKP